MLRDDDYIELANQVLMSSGVRIERSHGCAIVNEELLLARIAEQLRRVEEKQAVFLLKAKYGQVGVRDPKSVCMCFAPRPPLSDEVAECKGDGHPLCPDCSSYYAWRNELVEDEPEAEEYLFDDEEGMDDEGQYD